MKTIRLTILLVLLGFMMTQCLKDENIYYYAYNPQPVYFPHHVGSVWKYLRTDSIKNTSDTVLVRVKSYVHNTSRPYAVWTYEKSAMVFDSVYVYTHRDSVIITGPHVFHSKKILLLPYRLNFKWNSSGSAGDTTIVSSIERVNHHDAYKVIRRDAGIDLSVNDVMWLSPYVGLVQENIGEFSIVQPRHEFWRLISYRVK